MHIQFLDALTGKGDLRDVALDADDRASAELAVLNGIARLKLAAGKVIGRGLGVNYVGLRSAAEIGRRNVLTGLVFAVMFDRLVDVKQQILRQLLEEAGRAVILRRAVKHALLHMGQEQLILGAGDGDIHQTALLLPGGYRR